MSKFSDYYQLSKPGIIYGNILTAAGGFFLAAQGHVDGWLLLSTLGGLALVMASGCVFNNYLDRGLDSHMARTKRRALVSGTISVRGALIYATVIGLVGLAILAVHTTLLAAGFALLGLLLYVVIYGFAKRHTVHGTVVGSLSGSVPPVVGYTAVTGHFDAAAGLLFLILALWQMPHFYAIAIYRLEDYRAAKVPVLPAKRGIPAAKAQILVYIVAFTIAVTLLTITGYTGPVYLVVMVALGLYWLVMGLRGLRQAEDSKWARDMFKFSLIVVLGWCIMLSVDAALR